MVLGVVLLAVAVVLAVSLRSSARDPWFQAFDESWRSWMAHHRNGAVTGAARVLDATGSVFVTLPLRLVAAGFLAARRRWLQLAAFATAVVASEILINVLKSVIDRPRPPGGLVATTGASFPSGHAIAASVTAFGLVAAFLPRGRRRWHWFVGAALLAGAMSLSRTYLSVHWFTDTLAGTCIGTSLALLTEALFESHGRAIEGPDEATEELDP